MRGVRSGPWVVRGGVSSGRLGGVCEFPEDVMSLVRLGVDWTGLRDKSEDLEFTTGVECSP